MYEIFISIMAFIVIHTIKVPIWTFSSLSYVLQRFYQDNVLEFRVSNAKSIIYALNAFTSHIFILVHKIYIYHSFLYYYVWIGLSLCSKKCLQLFIFSISNREYFLFYLFINYNTITNYILILYELSNLDHVLGVV